MCIRAWLLANLPKQFAKVKCSCAELLGVVADPFAIQQVCLRWLYSILHSQPAVVTLHFANPCLTQGGPNAPSSSEVQGTCSSLAGPDCQAVISTQADATPAQAASAPAAAPHDCNAETSLVPPRSLVCRVVSEVTQLSSFLTAPARCACHNTSESAITPQQQSSGHCTSGSCLQCKQLSGNLNTIQVRTEGIQPTMLQLYPLRHHRRCFSCYCSIVMQHALQP